MTAPNTNYVKVGYQNPHAEDGLTLSLAIVSNTPMDEIRQNIQANSAKYRDWLKPGAVQDRPAILIGGGDSINDFVEVISGLDGDVFALNGASKWARGHGISVDYQVILDAKADSAKHVDFGARHNLIASQCHPDTLEAAVSPILWHLQIEDLESLFPAERVGEGGYTIIGGESTVGICALCIAYAMGYRDLHIFGYDSSHRGGKSHGYEQPQNAMMPTMPIEWGGKEFTVSIAMKYQAEKFQVYAIALKNAGCNISLYGDGLLQTIYNTPTANLTEQQKYQIMWQYDGYRNVSPGEEIVEFFISHFIKLFNPDGRIIDFGCGTGRAAAKLHEFGYDIILIDFTDNCRDQEALSLPFIQWDITNPIPVSSEWGFCTDVMEHIPPEDVDTVINNLLSASERVFFQISTIPDVMGGVINAPLHLTVESGEWWKNKFESLGYKVIFDQYLNEGAKEVAALFLVESRSGQ